MLRLISYIFLLAVSVWLGLEVVRHPGFLLIVYQPWMVQMPLWFAVLATLLLFVLFFFLIDSIDRIQFVWFKIKNWLRFRREHQFYSKTQHGLSALIEGRWKKSERLLLAGIHQTLEPLINYLAAAKAAHEQKAYDRRDKYIQTAYEIAPKADLAIGLTQAEFEMKQDQLEHAVATLQHLRQLSPYHPRVLRLLEKAYVRLGDWQSLNLLLPSMRKAKILTAEQAQLFEKNIYCEILQEANYKNETDLQNAWNNVPRAMKKNPDVVYAYVKQLARFNDNQAMENIIRQTLKHNWHAGLVKIYSTLTFTNLNRQLVIAGAWLKLYGTRPELLLLLGKLCVRVQLWGKAKDYFEKCLAEGPNPEASLEYGYLLEQLGEVEAAKEKYREGLSQLALLDAHFPLKLATPIALHAEAIAPISTQIL